MSWTRRSATAILAAVLGAAPAAACELCVGARSGGSPLVTGARLGVFLLLGITLAMLGAIAAFFLYLRHRAQRSEMEGIESEWTQLQRSSTS